MYGLKSCLAASTSRARRMSTRFCRDMDLRSAISPPEYWRNAGAFSSAAMADPRRCRDLGEVLRQHGRAPAGQSPTSVQSSSSARRNSHDSITDRATTSFRQTAYRYMLYNAHKALSTLATIVADFGDYSRQCGQGLIEKQIKLLNHTVHRRTCP